MNKLIVVYLGAGYRGLVDQNGREVIPFGRDISFGGWADGRLLVKRGEAVELVREDGTFIPLHGMESPTEGFPWFSEGLMPMQGPNSKVGFIDRAGRWAIAPSWERAWQFRGGLAIVQRDELTQLINRRGEVLKELVSLHMHEMWGWPADVWCFTAWHYASPSLADPCLVRGFSSIVPFRGALQITDPYQGVVGVRIGERQWELRALDGKTRRGGEWSSVLNFSCGLAVASNQEGLYGAIDPDGNWRILPVYDSLESFRFGLSVAERGGQKAVIDTTGRTVFRVGVGYPYIDEDHILLLRDDGSDVLDLNGRLQLSWPTPAQK